MRFHLAANLGKGRGKRRPANSSGGGGGVSDLSVNFTLNRASSGSTLPFCIGHTFRQGDVVDGDGVVVGNASAQVTPKNYWEDGSLKFAIIAGTYDQTTGGVAEEITLTDGAFSSGTNVSIADLKTAMSGQSCTINCGVLGSASFATTDFDSPHYTWIEGHKMSSWVYREEIDTHLVAWIEVRCYSTGDVEILPWVENGYLNVASPTNKSATYTFSLGGTDRFGGTAFDLTHHARQPLLDDSVSHWLGTDPAVTPKHDVEYLQQTTMVPSYDAVVTSSAAAYTRRPTSFTPMGTAPAMDSPTSMGTGGYGNHVALLPEWDVLYLVGDSSVDMWKAIQWTHYSMGAYAIHYRDENTDRPLMFSTHTDLSLNQSGDDANSGMKDRGSAASGTYTPLPAGTDPIGQWVRSHQPSVGYFAYLLTGRHYFLEELQFAATANYLAAGSSWRAGSSVFRSDVEQSRGFAWDLRTMAQAAAITPDGDTAMKAQFVDSVAANITYYRNLYCNPSSNPYGFIRNYGGGPDVGGEDDQTGTGDNLHWCTVFMQDFVTACVGYAKDLTYEALSTTVQGYFDTFFSFVALSVVGRLGNADSDEFLYRSASPYRLPIGAADNLDVSDSGAAWQTNWGEIYTDTYSHGSNPDNGSLGEPYAPNFSKAMSGNLGGGYFGDTTLAGGRWGYLQPALAYAVRNEADSTGPAHVGWSRIRNAPNWYLMTEAQAIGPITSVVPDPLPKWRQGIAVNEWYAIPDSSMDLTPPTTFQGGSGAEEDNKWNNWNGASLDTRTSRCWTLGPGGHGDYAGNEVMMFDCMQDNPAWVEWLEPAVYTTTITGMAASPRHLDDPTRLSGNHTYYNQQFIERHNRAVRVYSGSVSSGAGTAFADMDGFDITAGQGVDGTDARYVYPVVDTNDFDNRTGVFDGVLYPAYRFNTQGPATCKDPDTECIYVFKDNGTVRKFTPSAGGPDGTASSGGSWSSVGGSVPSGFNGFLSAAAFNSRTGKILILSSEYPFQSSAIDIRLFSFDAANSTWESEITGSASGSGLTSLRNCTSSMGLVYCPTTNCWYACNHLGTIWQITSAYVVTVLSVTGDTPPSTENVDGGTWELYENVYTRILYVPALGGLIYFPNYTADAHFLRIH